MAIMKFKRFEDLDRFEREGKGITWHFTTDKKYLNRALKIQFQIRFPRGLYKFKTFEEAEEWEMGWWVKGGTAKRTG
jgi:hypothetical protein